ncbi:unknown [Prevotella sp. CAG:1185]|nr:unknown [Prevotella sp. CAG:1185]
MDKKELFKIFLKVLIYAFGLLGAYFGVTSMTSCSVHRDVEISGKAVVITTDTTTIDHKGNVSLKVR